jgi:tRNA threonylcarbamoyladenosine biosynthesis protein TsaB
MALILNIDTAVETASICLAKKGEVAEELLNTDIRNHGAWLHTAIHQLLYNQNTELKKLDAIAVTIGPGSYTGLRIGLSAAKGLCYSLNIPLIAVNTLAMMANSVKKEDADLFCPMIDARRNEVFTGIYDKELTEVVTPHHTIVDEKSFQSFLVSRKIFFCGNGSKKLKSMITASNAAFSDHTATSSSMVSLSESYFQQEQFADVAYIEPLYLKDFYTPQ